MMFKLRSEQKIKKTQEEEEEEESLGWRCASS